jgi:transposase
MGDILSGRGNGGRYKRPNFPVDFKRQLAELSYEPGASVALIARQNDVNANLLFKWRHQYLEGAFGLPTKPSAMSTTAPAAAPALLPVSIVDESPITPAAPASAPDNAAKNTLHPDLEGKHPASLAITHNFFTAALC